MTKHAHFTLELDAGLKDAFIAAAEANHQPAVEILREFMDNYVRSHEEAESYQAFLARKVAVARKSLAAGKGQSKDEVEAEFAARRTATANNNG